MSDALLRTRLIRLAHAHPEFRKDLLPILASAKEAGLLSRQEVILRKYLDTVGPDRASMEFDGLPKVVRDALIRVKDSETLWMDVERWMQDNNNPHLRSKWAAKEAGSITPISEAKKGDTVEITHKGEKVKGKVVRVKKDGVVTVDVSGQHSDEDVGYVDVRPSGKEASARRAADFDPASIGEVKPGGSAEGVKGENGTESDAVKPWIKGEFTQQENVELLDKQEDGVVSDGKADLTPGKYASDKVLRDGLIRLAHSHPEFRKDLLPLLK